MFLSIAVRICGPKRSRGEECHREQDEDANREEASISEVPGIGSPARERPELPGFTSLLGARRPERPVQFQRIPSAEWRRPQSSSGGGMRCFSATAARTLVASTDVLSA